MKEHWSPAAEDEGSVHGTKLKVMRTKVTILTRWERQVEGGVTTTPAITTQPPTRAHRAEPIRGAHPPLWSAPSVKQKHKD